MIDAIKVFNKTLTEFIEDLIYICPDIPDLRVFHSTARLCNNIDEKFSIVLFQSCVTVPYKDLIFAKDEQFFLSESYTEYQPYMLEYGTDLDIVAKLKSIWKELDAENKEKVWKYLQALIILNRKYMENSI